MSTSSVLLGKSKCFLSLAGKQGLPKGNLSAICFYSTEERKVGKLSNVTSLKRGTGYRSSFSGTVATVFGGTGCIGTGVVQRLGKNGSQIVIPYRGEHYPYKRLKVAGDLGQVLFTPYDLRDEESIRKALKYSNVVVNVTGRDWETRNFSFEEINIHGPARLARLAREAGVKRFVHLSSVNARENPDWAFMRGGSKWLKTKWMGENAVKEEFPDATIFRCSDMYGTRDTFITHFTAPWRFSSIKHKALPLWKKGEQTVKAPIHAYDVVSGIMAALDDDSTKGITFEAYGPEMYKMSDLIDWMYYYMDKEEETWGYTRTDLRLDPSVFAVACIFSKVLPMGHRKYNKIVLDNLEKYSISDNILGLPNLEDLGVTPGNVKERMPYYLSSYKAYLYEDSSSLYKETLPIPTVDRAEYAKIKARNNQTLLESIL